LPGAGYPYHGDDNLFQRERSHGAGCVFLPAVSGENIMNERLESLLRRHDELSLMIQDPALVKNQNKYRETMKE
jgi:hypothetical protein